MGHIKAVLSLLSALSDSVGLQRCKLLLVVNDSIVSLGEEFDKLEHEKLALEEKVKDLEMRVKKDE